MSLPILFQDDYLVAIDKPAGLLVHRSPLAGDVQEYALQTLKFQLGQWVYPIHRLDRPTSGVLLFALQKEIAGDMIRQFQEREVSKTYWAVVRGYAPEQGSIDRPLRKEKGKEEKPASTHFQLLQKAALPIPIHHYPEARYSLVEAYPKTGRFHQIRRHLAGINHPVIGDQNHGDNDHNHLFWHTLEIPGLLLTAKRLSFTHPRSGQLIELEAEVSPAMRKAFGVLGFGEA